MRCSASRLAVVSPLVVVALAVGCSGSEATDSPAVVDPATCSPTCDVDAAGAANDASASGDAALDDATVGSDGGVLDGAADVGVGSDGATSGGAPTAQDSYVVTEIGEPVTSAMHATDPNGDPLTFSIVTPPTKGTLDNVDTSTGAFTYTPSSVGPGSDTFKFQVSDGTSSAPKAGTVTITFSSILFTGHWDVTSIKDNGASCSDSSFRIGHATPVGNTAGYFAVSQHVVSCGSTTYTFQPARFTMGGANNVTAMGMTYSQSKYVSGCGTVTDQFQLTRTATGFDYQETTNVPCYGIGTHVVTGKAKRTPSAYLFAEPTTTDFGRLFVGDPGVKASVLRNVGPVAATSVAVAAPSAPFSFEGGAYPGSTGTCGAQIAGGSSCTIAFALPTDKAVDAPTTSWSATYDDGLGGQVESSSLVGSVIPKFVSPTAVAAGSGFQCVIDSGKVLCWGASGSGQTTVPALTNPTAIAAGSSHACAIDDGGVHCWGSNSAGQTTVPALTSPTAISAGGSHTCALDASGVHCWGSNGYGQTTVPALTNPKAVSAGAVHTCALDDAGVHCWGQSTSGETTVPTLTNPKAVSAGNAFSCALDDTGVHCWGSNTFNRATPPALTGVTAIAAGGIYGCAIKSGATLGCWGFNLAPPSLSSVSAISTGYNNACAIAGGTVRCWGSQTYP